jgi:hypothetical protein
MRPSRFAMLFMVTDLTHESFPAFVSRHHLVVVHFWAAWNGYDLEIKRCLEQRVPLDLCNRIAFGRLDVDPPEHWELCKQHQILNVPFLAFYRDGVFAEGLIGRHDDLVVVEHLRRFVAS